MGRVIPWGQRWRSQSRGALLSCPHTPTLAFTHRRAHTCTHTYIRLHACTHVHTHTHKNTHEHRFVHASCLCTPVNFCPHTTHFHTCTLSCTPTCIHFETNAIPWESCQLEEKECLFFCPLKYIPSFKTYLKCYLCWASPNPH